MLFVCLNKTVMLFKGGLLSAILFKHLIVSKMHTIEFHLKFHTYFVVPISFGNVIVIGLQLVGTIKINVSLDTQRIIVQHSLSSNAFTYRTQFTIRIQEPQPSLHPALA